MPIQFKLFFVVLVLVCAFGPRAAQAMVSTSIEPVIGYERVQKVIPTPHTTERLVYGLRVVAGLPLVSVEAEALRGTDTESDPLAGSTIKDTGDKARVGLRSSIRLLGLVSFIARGGAQASRSTTEQTIAGVTTTSTTPIKYRPYLGAGLKAKLGKNFSLTADVTTVFNNFPSMNNNEYMTTAGFAVSFP